MRHHLNNRYISAVCALLFVSAIILCSCSGQEETVPPVSDATAAPGEAVSTAAPASQLFPAITPEGSYAEIYDDMFGTVFGNSGDTELAAAAVRSGNRIYVYTDVTEISTDTFIFLSNTGAQLNITFDPAASGTAPEVFSVFAADLPSQQLDIPETAELSGTEAELYYYVSGSMRSTEIHLQSLTAGMSLSDLTPESIEIQYPAVLISEGKCIGIIGVDNTLYPVTTTDIVSQITYPPEAPQTEGLPLSIVIICAAALFAAAAVLVILMYTRNNMKNNKEMKHFNDVPAPMPIHPTDPQMPGSISIGEVHNIGKRDSQQDSKGTLMLRNGIFAVVADGMGGLSNGDKVSRQIVSDMLSYAESLSSMTADNALFRMTAAANSSVNDMLGKSGGKPVSGSTMVAAFISGGFFHWVSVGDSRVYLYRGGSLIQLNREHNYASDLIIKAINGSVPFSEINTHPRKNGLTSFIGMGNLAHVDGSFRPIKLQPNDVLLLMSDGIFNTLNENEMSLILGRSANAQEAAAEFERYILSYQRPQQDNFTAIIIKI